MSLLWAGEPYLDISVLLLAVALDMALPEPPATLHPVVWMGKLIRMLEWVSPSSGRVRSVLAGACIALVVPAVFGGAAWWLALGLRELGMAVYVIGGAIILWTTFAVTGLSRAARKMADDLHDDDLEQARLDLRSLVSRDTRTLTPPLMAAAAVESVAENSTDSYVGPWLAFALLGLPGALAYRAVNTLDSMLGYHGKYEYLGKASARLDDVVNLVAARLTALLMIVGGALLGLPVRRGWATIRRDHGRTESPNAGWTMSAMSGLLGVVLEKPGHYRLGEGFREAQADDIHRAVRVGYVTAALALIVAMSLLLARYALSTW